MEEDERDCWACRSWNLPLEGKPSCGECVCKSKWEETEVSKEERISNRSW